MSCNSSTWSWFKPMTRAFASATALTSSTTGMKPLAWQLEQEIDVTALKIDHSIHIKDLGRTDLEYALPLDSPIVTVLSPRKLTEAPTAAEAAAEAEAGPAEPEVITEKKPTEEEAEGEEEKGKGKAKTEAKAEKKEEKKEEKKKK